MLLNSSYTHTHTDTRTHRHTHTQTHVHTDTRHSTTCVLCVYVLGVCSIDDQYEILSPDRVYVYNIAIQALSTCLL